jgi:hypothetical protein
MPPVTTSLPPYPTAENVLQLVRTLVLDAGISIAGNLLGDNSPGVVIASISESGGTVTVTTQQAHGLNVGNLVMVSNVVPAGYNGQFAVVSVPALNQFTYLNPAVGLAAGTGGSVSISPSQAFILLNSAYQYVQDKIANLGFETPIEEAFLLNIPPVPQSVQGTATRVFIGYDIYFNGLQNLKAPVLPPDLKIPLVLKERCSGQNLGYGFRPMGMANDGLTLRCQLPYFDEWEWRGDRIYLIGATQNLDLYLRYEAFFPALVFPGDSIRIFHGGNAVAYTMANRFSAPRMGDVGGYYVSERDEEIKQIATRYAHKNLRKSIRRQPYGYAHASGQNEYDYF